MYVNEYLSKLPRDQKVTFVIGRAVQEGALEFYHFEYRTAPIRPAWEWGLHGEIWDGYIVLNADHPPVSIEPAWHNWYKNGDLSCALVTTEADLRKMYSERQAADMIKYYHENVVMKGGK